MSSFTNEDCMDLMARYPDKYFELAIVDPPYNVGKKYKSYYDKKTQIEYTQWCDEWFQELNRVTQCILITTGYVNMKYWINKNPLHIFIWYKPNQNSSSPIGGFNVWEPVFIFGKIRRHVGHDLFMHSIALQKDAGFHICPKHLPSWKIIIKKFSNPGDKIIDIFMGSGTTALACEDLGFEYVGCELDKDYYKAACERIAIYKSQGKLDFD